MSTYFMQYCATWSIYEIADDENEIHQNSDQNLTYEVDIISADWLALSQLFIKVAKISLENANDNYLEFSSLIVLDNIF